MGKSAPVYDQILDRLRQAYDGEAERREARGIVDWKKAARSSEKIFWTSCMRPWGQG